MSEAHAPNPVDLTAAERVLEAMKAGVQIAFAFYSAPPEERERRATRISLALARRLTPAQLIIAAEVAVPDSPSEETVGEQMERYLALLAQEADAAGPAFPPSTSPAQWATGRRGGGP